MIISHLRVSREQHEAKDSYGMLAYVTQGTTRVTLELCDVSEEDMRILSCLADGRAFQVVALGLLIMSRKERIHMLQQSLIAEMEGGEE